MLHFWLKKLWYVDCSNTFVDGLVDFYIFVRLLVNLPEIGVVNTSTEIHERYLMLAVCFIFLWILTWMSLSFLSFFKNCQCSRFQDCPGLINQKISNFMLVCFYSQLTFTHHSNLHLFLGNQKKLEYVERVLPCGKFTLKYHPTWT